MREDRKERRPAVLPPDGLLRRDAALPGPNRVRRGTAGGEQAGRQSGQNDETELPHDLACVPKRAAPRRPPCTSLTAQSSLVERALDLRDLLRFEIAAGLAAAARLDLAAEVESQPGKGIGTVGADFLERSEELLLGLRPS